MFRPQELWYHEDSLDIGLLVLGVKYRGLEAFKVKACLVNRHNGIWYETKTYKIRRSEFKHWRML
jgi:hypothetical protein